MIKAFKYQNTPPTIVEKSGISYKIVDMGGYKMEIRIKDSKEIERDTALFNLTK